MATDTTTDVVKDTAMDMAKEATRITDTPAQTTTKGKAMRTRTATRRTETTAKTDRTGDICEPLKARTVKVPVILAATARATRSKVGPVCGIATLPNYPF